MQFRHIALASAFLAVSSPRLVLAQDPVDTFAQQAQATSSKFVETMLVLMASKETMDAARGIKDTTEVRKKLIEDAKKSLTKADIKVIQSLTAKVEADSKSMNALAAETAAMTAEQKTLFKTGLVQYLIGVKETASLAGELPKLLSAATETASALMSNPLKFRKVKDAVGAVKEMGSGLPAVVKSHGASIGAIKNYVVKQGIDVDMSGLKIGGS